MTAKRRMPANMWAALICAALLPNICFAVDSVVTQWLTVAQNTVLSLGIEHQQAARVYGIVASAQYDAVLAARAYKAAAISDELAVVYASHAALSNLFYWRQSSVYDVALAQNLAQLNVSGSVLPALQNLVVPVVQKILSARLRDGISLYANFKPFDNSTANFGRYQYTPGQTTVRYPQVANATTFWVSSSAVDAFTRNLTRLSLSDPEYAKQLQQVYLYGSANSTVRSPYDSVSPRFWALGAGTGTIAGVWLNISISVVPNDTSIIQQARFFKLLTTSWWDAAVACWRTKFRELFWRPITAIRTPHGVPPTDPTWTPLLPTPAHPEYPSGHQCTSGAAVYVLEAFLGTNFPFSASSQGAPDAGLRSYPSFRAAGIESGDSRLYAGLHFNKSNIDALNLGYRIAQHIHKVKFQSATFSTPI